MEITSTYQGSLRRTPSHPDVVLGYDLDNDTFVGLDPLRLEHGGPTQNASSFVDLEGLRWADPGEIHVRPRPTELRASGLENQAFFKAPCLLEYILSYEDIHAGLYLTRRIVPTHKYPARDRYEPIAHKIRKLTDGRLIIVAPPKKPEPPKSQVIDPAMVERFERGDDLRQKLSPADLRRLLQICEENGRLGEFFVLADERRRLKACGRSDLARRVRWISQESVLEGYDILSFEEHGDERLIEVKSTNGTGTVFLMSHGEWRVAVDRGPQYCVYRVVNVRTRPEIVRKLRDPVALEGEGKVTRRAFGYRVDIS